MIISELGEVKVKGSRVELIADLSLLLYHLSKTEPLVLSAVNSSLADEYLKALCKAGDDNELFDSVTKIANDFKDKVIDKNLK